MTDQDDQDNVTRISPSLARTRIVTIRRPGRTCAHTHVQVDSGARIVACVACKAVLDPITVLVQFARHADWVATLGSQKRKLEAEIEDLKRQRSNLKAAVRRASSKAETSHEQEKGG